MSFSPFFLFVQKKQLVAKSMIRSLLPTPQSLLGCVRLSPAATLIASSTAIWQLFCLITDPHTLWSLYRLWLLISSLALFYGQHKKDSGHIHWFAVSLFFDILVYVAYIPYDPEFTMSAHEQCRIAMATSRQEMTMEYCLGHLHEIHQIAYMMRVAAVLVKTYLASIAYSYELKFSQ